MVHDRAPAASHFSRDYRAGVQRSAKTRHCAELALKLRRGARECLLDGEEAYLGTADFIGFLTTDVEHWERIVKLIKK